jgi:hypothetical protein
MTVRAGAGRLILSALLAFAAAALFVPGIGVAATVVNGGFESGNLQGWTVQRATELGDWFAYAGTRPPISGKEVAGSIPSPPQGDFAAVTDEYNPDTVVLYQDVFLRPGYDHRLSLLAFYVSQAPIAVPSPDTLSVDDGVLGSAKNQQYRIDVMRPEAALESIAPGDVLRTLLQTRKGDPATMAPARLSADLSPFAGQTVRLRFTVAAHEETLNGGVDAVAVESAPPGQLPPLGPNPGGSNPGAPGRAELFSFGKPKPNLKTGSVTLPVRVSGAGLLRAKSAAKLVKPASVKAAAAGVVKLRLNPTPKALAILKRKHKLQVKLAVSFEPQGDGPETATVPLTLKLKAPPPRP